MPTIERDTKGRGKKRYLIAFSLASVFLVCCLGYFIFKTEKDGININQKAEINSLLGTGKYSEALAILEKYSSSRTQNTEFFCSSSGMANFGEKQYLAAAVAYENCAKIVSGAKKIAYYQNLAGNCYRESGDYTQAITSYRSSIKNNSSSQTTWINLINAYLNEGEKSEAGESAKMALKSLPNSTEIKKLLEKVDE